MRIISSITQGAFRAPSLEFIKGITSGFFICGCGYLIFHYAPVGSFTEYAGFAISFWALIGAALYLGLLNGWEAAMKANRGTFAHGATYGAGVAFVLLFLIVPFIRLIMTFD